MREFDLSDVLSATTGRLLSLRHMEGIYDVLNYMTGDNLMTHQLPRAMDQVKPEILRQHPDLDGVDPPQGLNQFTLLEWLDAAKAEHGATRTLVPLEDYEWQNPIEELADMVGPERIYVVPVPNTERRSD